jgi:outer membrane receptor protein involved in Fe transport
MKPGYRRRFFAFAAATISWCAAAAGQEALPTIDVGAAPPQVAARRAPASPRNVPTQEAPSPTSPTTQAATTLDRAADVQERLLPKAGANVYALDLAAIEALPQGDQTPLEKILLQTPGVSQDSAASGNLHIRNEHANVQYRVNGILLPDGVSGFSQLMETSFASSISLITGALPAQYGLRTSALVDIVSRAPSTTPGGSVSIYGGSHGTGQTAFDYGAKIGQWEVFAAGRLIMNSLGIENPTSNYEAIHDRTRQGRFFGFLSYTIDDATKLSFITGTSLANYQIPNNPGHPPQFTAFGASAFDSGNLNENQVERSYYNVVALTHAGGDVDTQLSFFSRYSELHFVPDEVGDLVFNGVSSDIYRSSFVNGLQGDGAYRVGGGHTLRAGFTVNGEKTQTVNSSIIEPLDANGNPIDAPFGVSDPNSKLGWLAGVYAQDEWKITDRLTLNSGLRFDQMWQFVDTNQLSPRVSVVYRPVNETAFHIGYARYFTPPQQALAVLTNLALYNNTTQQPSVPLSSPVRPERANYIDTGVTQKLTKELEIGVDAYFKRARNLIDDGQFGQALVLTAFNYDRAYNTGVEFKSIYQSGDFRAYGNLAWGRQRATRVTSNQFLFDASEFPYIATNYINTDHAQTWTGSAGACYRWLGTLVSADLIYGSGLRSGFANTDHVAPYAQVNLGLSREISTPWGKPVTLRFDVVNLLDHSYELRSGSGIGVFAPQYGPSRGIFAGLKQAF